MEKDLSDFEVTSRQSFANFAQELKNNLLQKPEDWENKTLEDFLDAISAYAEDIHGYYKNIDLPINADIPSWQVFAYIMKGATMYE
jgi:hypothetical protein